MITEPGTPPELRATRLTGAQFGQMADEWAALLKNSEADPLFMSWPWLYSWWETWSTVLSLELMLLAVRDPSGELIGLAPLYRHRFRTPVGFVVNRVHFIGNAWHVSPTVRTEYVGLIAQRGREAAVAKQLLSYLHQLDWDELILADSHADSLSWLEDGFSAQDSQIHRVVRSEAEGVRLGTTGAIETWRGALGRNTRLKAFNRRQFFESELGGQFRRLGDGRETQEWFLQRLNQLQELRWHKPCFDPLAVAFHLKLMGRLGERQSLRLSVLESRGMVVSVLYDIRAGDRVYNIQAGYYEDLHKKLSLGTLHLGYAIEAAFEAADVAHYDLLAGSGKHSFYKSHFRGERVEFATLQYIRSPLLKFAYSCQSRLPHGMRTRINRAFRF